MAKLCWKMIESSRLEWVFVGQVHLKLSFFAINPINRITSHSMFLSTVNGFETVEDHRPPRRTGGDNDLF